MSSRLCTVSRAPAVQTSASDWFVPCHYWDVSSGYGLTGEQRLMLAMLTDALNVYQKGALSRLSKQRRLYVDAERWIMFDRVDANAFSFTTVCEALGINPDLMRRRVIDWKHTVCAQQRANCSARLRLRIMPRQRNPHVRINSAARAAI
jgi:hypothetical protein